jgi:hypothetical protein
MLLQTPAPTDEERPPGPVIAQIHPKEYHSLD